MTRDIDALAGYILTAHHGKSANMRMVTNVTTGSCF